MEPEKDTVEGVLADLIDHVEWKEEAWLLQREKLHRRQSGGNGSSSLTP